MGNNMSDNLQNLNSPEVQESLNKHLNTSEGAEEAAKSAPIALGSTLQGIEDGFRDTGEQILVLTSSFSDMVDRIAFMEQMLAGFMQFSGYNPNQNQQPQASGQIQPTQGQQGQNGILEQIIARGNQQQQQQQQ